MIMKKIILLLATVTLSYANTIAQSCLPQGINFTTQEQIDNFQTNYPGCTMIVGNVKIKGADINNLNGLNVLTHIAGNLTIGEYPNGNPLLTNLEGLDNLTSIGGLLRINYNSSLSTCNSDWLCNYLSAPTGTVYISNNTPGCNTIIDIAYSCGGLPCLPPHCTYFFYSQSDIDNFQAAFPNCTEILGDLYIFGAGFFNLDGLSVLTSIGGDLYIQHCYSLNSLSGLNNLTTIGGDLYLFYNSSLTNLTGLENLTHIGGDITIGRNASLTSFSGIEGLNSTVGKLLIYGNDGLVDLTGLECLTSIGTDLLIEANHNLINLTGLDNLTEIKGYFVIGYAEGNDSMISFEGLGNLTSIGDVFSIGYNISLFSLTGLENLNSIGWSFSIHSNSSLSSLTELINLTSIGNKLSIGGDWASQGNPQLTSLAGLDNISAASITNLYIKNNNFLSTCHIQSICDYLAAPNGTVIIQNNAPGCNSQAQVIEACTVSIDEIILTESFSIFPNPANDQLTIQLLLEKPEPLLITVLNFSGQQMAMVTDDHPKAGEYQAEIDISNWPVGVYFCRVQVGNKTTSQKIIKIN
jgi:hypothetical protein